VLVVFLEMVTAALDVKDVVRAVNVVHHLEIVFQLLSIVLLQSLSVFVHVTDVMDLFEE